MDAIRSIPAYVENSTLIMILAPLLTHQDAKNADGSPVQCTYKLWRSRGWCRMEYIAAILAKRPVPLMLVLGADCVPEFVNPIDMFLMAAGDGNFTCCSRNHDFGNGPVECDKGTVRGVMELMLDSKVAHLHATDDIIAARWFESLRPWLLRRLPPRNRKTGGEADEEYALGGESAVSLLKERMRWREGKEASLLAKTGMTLLLFATASDDLAAVCELLCTNPADANAPVKQNLLEPHRAPPIFKGCTPLLLAMAFASWPVVQALLDAGANRHAVDLVGHTPLHTAAMFGRSENIKSWLQLFSGTELKTSIGGIKDNTALHMCCFYGPDKRETLRELLRANADLSAVNMFGSNPIQMHAHNPDADIEVMRALLSEPQPGAPTVNSQRHVPGCLIPFIICVTRLLAQCCGSKSKMVRFFAMMEGSTALHIAAMHGDVELCRMLIASGADTTLRNRLGMTPLDVARWFGNDSLFVGSFGSEPSTLPA